MNDARQPRPVSSQASAIEHDLDIILAAQTGTSGQELGVDQVRPWASILDDVATSASKSTSSTSTAKRGLASDASDDVEEAPAVGSFDASATDVVHVSDIEHDRSRSLRLDNRRETLLSEGEASLQVGEAADSVATESSNTTEQRDCFPLLDVVVHLSKQNVGFACKRDTGSDISVLAESTLERLGHKREDLPPAGRDVFGFSGKAVELLGRITVTFFVIGVGVDRPFKMQFYVAPDEYLCNHDAILSEWFLKKYKFFVDGLPEAQLGPSAFDNAQVRD
jgi:hypothetical protein